VLLSLTVCEASLEKWADKGEQASCTLQECLKLGT